MDVQPEYILTMNYSRENRSPFVSPPHLVRLPSPEPCFSINFVNGGNTVEETTDPACHSLPVTFPYMHCSNVTMTCHTTPVVQGRYG